MRILYLGLRPKPNTFHYPVIRTQRCACILEALKLWPQFTHAIFTSQTAVEYWPGPWDKKMIAIGSQTALALQKKKVDVQIAKEATQEGVAEIVKEIRNGYFFIPRSKRARAYLTQFMQREKIRFFALDLYDTLFQKLEPVPILDDFDEIVFTSPSTVEGFFRIYGELPKNKKLTAIGPITAQALKTIDLQLKE